LLTSINPDAHDTQGLGLYEAGVVVARKGWLRREHVFNTRPLEEVKAYLAEKRQARR
jgi:DNA polymerase (family X)